MASVSTGRIREGRGNCCWEDLGTECVVSIKQKLTVYKGVC